LLLALARRREPRGWSGRRTAAFLAGAGLLVSALVPQLSPFPPHDFRGHMYQHLLVGMYAPIGLALGAPVTLLLRSLPAPRARAIGRLLRSRPVQMLARPATALALNLGGLAVLYFTPLYAAAAGHPVLHGAVMFHFLAAGYLFAWAVAGPDPAPHRPSVPVRLVLLGAAIAGHAVLSQLLYAGLFVQVPAPALQLRQAGELMYYGGDIAELLLALALVSTWRPDRRGAALREDPGGSARRGSQPGNWV
ncbi:cytochrome c oxidase assembly protein, partial [Arthrobacter sp. GCM10027362]|uniref:cytochrome c oxidase assembly protein n=1 Tax=Arthrobacter sp. GCM10027362 TaxID=3273379 RepID=UPI0036409D01